MPDTSFLRRKNYREALWNGDKMLLSPSLKAEGWKSELWGADKKKFTVGHPSWRGRWRWWRSHLRRNWLFTVIFYYILQSFNHHDRDVRRRLCGVAVDWSTHFCRTPWLCAEDFKIKTTAFDTSPFDLFNITGLALILNLRYLSEGLPYALSTLCDVTIWHMKFGLWAQETLAHIQKPFNEVFQCLRAIKQKFLMVPTKQKMGEGRAGSTALQQPGELHSMCCRRLSSTAMPPSHPWYRRHLRSFFITPPFAPEYVYRHS